VLFSAARGNTAAGVKIATWNLNWLTPRPAGDPALPRDVTARRDADFTRLAAYAAQLDAGIIAFEEVDGVAAASQLFPPDHYVIEVGGGNAVQKTGFAIRRGILYRRNPDLAALEINGAGGRELRAGVDITVELPRAGGAVKLRMLAVHLKSGCARGALAPPSSFACIALAAQIDPLAAWVRARGHENLPFVLLGDFNREFDRPEKLGDALQAAAPMRRLTAGYQNPCWGGEHFIDHIFAGNGARQWIVPDSFKVLVYRERAYRLRDKISDHCPVSVRLAP
jgi:endonuclease/exonuclease/phosphatase family metal-dependent hydrolase